MSSSSKKLTKFVSAQTVVTADLANSFFGGLFDSKEGQNLPVTHPLVAGHVHDGSHTDGHAQKINLVSHVTGELQNTHLADEAVTERNLAKYADKDLALPISTDVDGTTYYYLNLDNTPFVYDADEDVISNANSLYESTDFVFGSPQLDNDADSEHYSRFFFKKSLGAFRAGTAESDEWDDANVAENSAAFGVNNMVSEAESTIAGGKSNIISGLRSFIGAGLGNEILGARSAILTGETNTVDGSDSAIVCGNSGNIDSNNSSILSGSLAQIDEDANHVTAQGISPWGYILCQQVLGGGLFSGGGPKGQSQFSSIPMRCLVDTVATLTRAYVNNSSMSPLTIQTRRVIFARANWVARNHSGGYSAAGERTAIIRRELGAPVIDYQTSTYAQQGNHPGTFTVAFEAGSTDEITLTFTVSSNVPCVVTAKVDWIEVWADGTV